MPVLKLKNYALDEWREGESALTGIDSPVSEEVVAECGAKGLDFGSMVKHARDVGGPALRNMTLHQRAGMIKALGTMILERKEELYALNQLSGATRGDGWIDIEGGAGTFLALASRAKRDLPDSNQFTDGPIEKISRRGTFIAQHVYSPRQGVAVHINAFNFPVWGMMEKLAPTLIAGMPAIVKPALQTAYLAEAAFRMMIESGLLPEGALQLVVGDPGNLLDHLSGQDVVSFTGSAETASLLKSNPTIVRQGVRFIAEQDSVNACVLGPNVESDDPEFGLFVDEVVKEMTVKAGQKCTAIRRIFAPARLVENVQASLVAALHGVTFGNPVTEKVKMGTLVSSAQLRNVQQQALKLSSEARIVFGDLDALQADAGSGAILAPMLLRCDEPKEAKLVHEIEAFGPIAVLMPYDTVDDAAWLCNAGGGSLVMSLFTNDEEVARKIVSECGAFHGRMAVINRDSAEESTGHGSPLPFLVHGGPGRAGGGEELGGLIGIKSYMQRSAIQGSPSILAGVTGVWTQGARTEESGPHPFRLSFNELEVGRTIETGSREITLEDIEYFADFTGDNFYAHMDEEAARANPFFAGRVAHGYLVLAFAAGLFVDPAPGPVLANYGLDELRFLKPAAPGDSIRVRLTAKSKKKRNSEYGEVKWDVLVLNQDDDLVASYDLLTMNAM